ncbi:MULTISPECIES: PspC domain-containing protein [unclassified Streptomyces]|uniref:PspC domain-containing protein n=1 Tax=unclassified Streptomyces TaxID=2593676 RepID=UPI000DB91D21|nr:MULTISPECIES: PspC domain-containing protein [unclassified Streptomyces]MYT68589.1 PspC domain-containing protein [Streptomyces sp. SID8367]RAJ86261.1 phage shock protein C (PspC) family protein [Streptomyces sp. PsTaAH-137]
MTHEDAPAAAAAPGSEPEPAPLRRFRRDRRHKTLGGVCAGLGRHCDMDPVIFRIGLAVLAVTGGVGLIFYGFAWLFVAYDDEDENEFRKLLTGRVDGPGLAAIVTALVGCGVFLSMLNNGGALSFAAVLALLLAGSGYWSQRRTTTAEADPVAAQAVADAPPEAQAPPVAGAPSWWRDPIVKDGTHVGGTGYFWGPPDLARAASGASSGSGAGGWGRPVAPKRPPGPRGIGALTFLGAVVAGLVGAGVTWEDRSLGHSLQTGLACALAVFGLGIAVSAFRGRTGVGSIVLAVITAGLLTASAALPSNISTRWMHRDWVPASASDVSAKYELGSGVGTLDLTEVRPGAGKKVSVHVEVGAGQARVIVPAGATVELHAEVGVGDVQLPGDASKDVDVQPGVDQRATLAPPAGTKASGTVELHVEVGVGQVEVSRAS